jgi:hypothetical protein
LDLEEVSSYSIPDSFPVTRVSAAPDGTIALSSNRWSHLLIGRGGKYEEFGMGLLKRPVSVTFDSNGSVVEVVDAGIRSILQFNGSQVVGQRTIDAPITITDAIHSDSSGWWVAGVDSTGLPRVISLPKIGKSSSFRLSRLSRDNGQAISLSLTASGRLIVTRLREPYQWIVLTPGKRPTVTQVFDTTKWVANDNTPNFLTPLWVAQELVPVGKFMLYSVADLRSDQRKLLLVAGSGHMIRESSLNAPVGLAGYIPGSPYILALRGVNGQHLVTYRWRWRG